MNIFSLLSQNALVYRFYLQKHAELEIEMQSLRELKHREYTNAIQMLEDQFRSELEAEEIADQVMLILFMVFFSDSKSIFSIIVFNIMCNPTNGQ